MAIGRSAVELDRKTFLGGMAATFGGIVFPVGAFGVEAEPLLRFGVASDVHVIKGWGDGNSKGLANQERYLEKALRWFDSEKVDAVVFPGDMAHTGRIAELESIAATWERVFPGFTAADGRRVERLLVTGNHEIGQWQGLWDAYSDEELKRIRFDYDREHMRENWKRIFGEDYELIWKREVKGITFVGAQYPRTGHMPDYSGFFAEHAAEFREVKPFFFIQHAHPAHTCYGEEASLAWAERVTHELLSRFPHAVAISGHSHNTPCDERSVWQGAFTSIGAGSVAEAGPCYSRTRYDNGGAPYDPRYKKQRMKCPSQVGNDGRACLLVDVYADRLVVKRRSLTWDEPLGPDWTIPVPARPGGEYDFLRRAAMRPAPQFAPTARAVAEICTKEPESTGPGLKGKPVVRVSFPCAETVKGTRVFDYVVKVFADGREVMRSTVLNAGYYLPEPRSHVEGECILGQYELPKGKGILFTVTPRDCYGVAGAALASNTIRLD